MRNQSQISILNQSNKNNLNQNYDNMNYYSKFLCLTKAYPLNQIQERINKNKEKILEIEKILKKIDYSKSKEKSDILYRQKSFFGRPKSKAFSKFSGFRNNNSCCNSISKIKNKNNNTIDLSIDNSNINKKKQNTNVIIL